MARPACKATTTMRRILDVRTSVAERTGYLRHTLEDNLNGSQVEDKECLQITEKEKRRNYKSQAYKDIVQN